MNWYQSHLDKQAKWDWGQFGRSVAVPLAIALPSSQQATPANTQALPQVSQVLNMYTLDTPQAPPILPKTPTDPGETPVKTPNQNENAALIDQIKGHEGFRAEVYPDPLLDRNAGSDPTKWKAPTVGYGFNLRGAATPQALAEVGLDWNAILSGQQSMTQQQADQLVEVLANQSVAKAREDFPNFDRLHPVARDIIANMSYQMGSVGSWKDLRRALTGPKPDYLAASRAMLDSKWARQTPNRAKELAAMMARLGG
ncbi:MAG: hypothetical protein HC888_06100 [Candidatus Competibacteraceae bacterium]|nr:hypothetical protein [Candidatus Competibacteraceae bacterium]